ncbi:hypothetical protein HP567_011605 [Brevibacillus sp. M2.1A]|uniref:hypothetical protein n=1 Tax=Brevibacillus TaxID=55080 RepID=UPI00156AB524|nr:MULTISPECIES: hypothetical protein [Brevibacillus]MCC8435189.1 hypothetical protein [Brevibacillus sp. M2.1A]MCM3141914.1 hypothetical protein [Brevibacillus sp. MER 51]WJQ83329.1 hypothetical protein QN310_09405 [Brevibacillus brevis]
MRQVLKWSFLLCTASFVLNGLLYVGTGDRHVLISMLGAVGLAVLSASWLLFAKKKQ